MHRALALALALVSPAARADITMMDHSSPPKTGFALVPLAVSPALRDDDAPAASRADPRIALGGVALFGTTYLASVLVAATSEHAGSSRLDVPLVGPWLALADGAHCAIPGPSCNTSASDKALLVADGVAQATGVFALLDGLVWPRVRNRTEDPDTRLHVKPTGSGMELFAHF
jgi:hypothetical protein